MKRSFRVCRTWMYKCRERRMRRNGLLTPLTYVHVGQAHQIGTDIDAPRTSTHPMQNRALRSLLRRDDKLKTRKRRMPTSR